MISHEQYKKEIAEPTIAFIFNFIKNCENVQERIPDSRKYRNTPHISIFATTDEDGGTVTITEVYNLKVDIPSSSIYVPSIDKAPMVDAILMFLNELPGILKVNKELTPIKDFKKYLLSLDRNPKIIPWTKFNANREKIKEKGVGLQSIVGKLVRLIGMIKELHPKYITIVDPSTVDLSTIIKKEKPKPDPSRKLDIEIKNAGITSNFVSEMTLENVLFYKKCLNEAKNIVENSRVPGFKKVLSKARFIIGNKKDIEEKTHTLITGENAIGLYVPLFDMIYFFIDNNEDSSDTVSTLIHELAHRFHRRFIKNGFENEDFIRLWKKAYSVSNECYRKNLPEIGDPLSNYRENWWSVSQIYPKQNIEDYVLTENSGDYHYTFTNSHNRKITFTRNQLLKLISCPSTYSMDNESEFFSELCTLITLDRIKPSQKELEDIFIDMVNKNLL